MASNTGHNDIGLRALFRAVAACWRIAPGHSCGQPSERFASAMTVRDLTYFR